MTEILFVLRVVCLSDKASIHHNLFQHRQVHELLVVRCLVVDLALYTLQGFLFEEGVRILGHVFKVAGDLPDGGAQVTGVR